MSDYIVDSFIITIIVIHICVCIQRGACIKTCMYVFTLIVQCVVFLVLGYQGSLLQEVRWGITYSLRHVSYVDCMVNYERSSAHIAGVLEWTGGCQRGHFCLRRKVSKSILC